jgi:carboxyl-terminal processing protease
LFSVVLAFLVAPEPLKTRTDPVSQAAYLLANTSKARPDPDDLLEVARQAFSNEESTNEAHRLKAMNRMLETLDDRWACVYNPEQHAAMKAALDGDEEGSLGFRSLPVSGGLEGRLVVDVAPNGPAAGRLVPGDRILEVDGVPLKSGVPGQRKRLLLGKPGRGSHLLVADRENRLRELELVREDLNAPTAHLIEDGEDTVTLRIGSFGQETAVELRTLLQKYGDRPLILDLRYNGGGYIDSAVECASLFLPRGSFVVSTGERTEKTKSFPIHPHRVAVLVNHKTASAAEIFTAALDFHGDALVVGVKTYGKGSVQRVTSLQDQWSVKFTTSLYRTASGDIIDGVGIVPDQVIAIDPTDLRTEHDLQWLAARKGLQKKTPAPL